MKTLKAIVKSVYSWIAIAIFVALAICALTVGVDSEMGQMILGSLATAFGGMCSVATLDVYQKLTWG